MLSLCFHDAVCVLNVKLTFSCPHQYEDCNMILVTDYMIKRKEKKKTFSSTQINQLALEFTPKMENIHKEIPVNGVS